MSQRSHLARISHLNGSAASEHGSGSAFGYGRPPAHSRFRPGRSGNPRGRPKGQRNVRTVLTETLNQKVKIREGDRTRSVTKLDAVIVTTVNRAVNGDPKALASLVVLMRSAGLIAEAPEVADQQPITGNDAALLADFLQRQQQASPQSEGSEGNEQSAPHENTPPNEEKKP